MRDALVVAGIFACAALFVAISVIVSQTQPPLDIRYEPQANSQRPAEPTGNAQQGTRDSPIVVELVNPQKTDEETAKENAERQQDRVYTRLTARYTGLAALFAAGAVLVAIAQVILFAWQLGLMREGIKDASDAAKAAGDSAKAALGTLDVMQTSGRAFVFLTHVEMRAIKSKNCDKVERFLFIFHWQNSGSTGTKSLFAQQNFTAISGDLPKDFAYPYQGAPVLMPIGPTATVQGDPIEIPLADMEAVSQNRKNVYLWGRVDYHDVFGKPRFTQTCRRMFVVPSSTDPFASVSVVHHGDYNRTEADT